MKVSIIIPSFNEGGTISQIIKKVISVLATYNKEASLRSASLRPSQGSGLKEEPLQSVSLRPSLNSDLKEAQNQTEIIVIDDGSTDKTHEELNKWKANKEIKIITNKKNQGKGASIVKALKIATGDIILIQDADLEYNPNEIPRLVNKFIDPNVKVVYGSRVLIKNPISHWTFNIGGRLITLVTNLLYRTGITDEPTGYKAFKKEVLKNMKLNCKGFEFCPEVTAKIAKKQIKITEVPISYNPRSIAEKKIKWLDGLAAIYYLFKYKFTD